MPLAGSLGGSPKRTQQRETPAEQHDNEMMVATCKPALNQLFKPLEGRRVVLEVAHSTALIELDDDG